MNGNLADAVKEVAAAFEWLDADTQDEIRSLSPRLVEAIEDLAMRAGD